MTQQIIDISWPLSPAMTTYKDSKPITITAQKTFENDSVRDSAIFMNMHTGTHVDAPNHFLQAGEGIESISLEYLIGPCRVLDLTDVTDAIRAHDLEAHNPQREERLLLKTKNSFLPHTEPFLKDFIYLDKGGAEFLASKRIKTVAIDYLGIERNQPAHETHLILFNANIVIIEGVRLEKVQAGAYTLYCLPLALQHVEAAPARAILINR